MHTHIFILFIFCTHRWIIFRFVSEAEKKSSLLSFLRKKWYSCNALFLNIRWNGMVWDISIQGALDIRVCKSCETRFMNLWQRCFKSILLNFDRRNGKTEMKLRSLGKFFFFFTRVWIYRTSIWIVEIREIYTMGDGFTCTGFWSIQCSVFERDSIEMLTWSDREFCLSGPLSLIYLIYPV